MQQADGLGAVAVLAADADEGRQPRDVPPVLVAEGGRRWHRTPHRVLAQALIGGTLEVAQVEGLLGDEQRVRDLAVAGGCPGHLHRPAAGDGSRRLVLPGEGDGAPGRTLAQIDRCAAPSRVPTGAALAADVGVERPLLAADAVVVRGGVECDRAVHQDARDRVQQGRLAGARRAGHQGAVAMDVDRVVAVERSPVDQLDLRQAELGEGGVEALHRVDHRASSPASSSGSGSGAGSGARSRARLGAAISSKAAVIASTFSAVSRA